VSLSEEGAAMRPFFIGRGKEFKSGRVKKGVVLV
jgi:hypothetical protein